MVGGPPCTPWYVQWHTTWMGTFELLAEIADRVEADLDSVVAEMDRAIMGTIPALATDVAIAAEASASTRANVRRYLAVARRAADPPPPDVPPEALDVARTVVRRGIESDAIYQAYRRGQQTLWRRWMKVAEQVATSGTELADVLNVSLDLLFYYADEVLGRVIAEAQREREQVLGGALARRAEVIRLILDGAPLEITAASRRLGHDLRRHHTALVLWTETAESQQGALEATALALAHAAGARRPLTFTAGTTTLWAWIGSDAPLATGSFTKRLPDTDPHVRIAVGPTRRGIGGFRRSHEAALTVHRLLVRNPEGGRIATYEELEITALAAQDEQRATDFIAATLGPLADNTASAARLRETLRVFLEEAENAPRTAVRLHTHRNTILQRIARATELLGYAPGERRLAVELALELRRRLGHPVLADRR
jgi:DNA-binding PucR family transcriptional regulator